MASPRRLAALGVALLLAGGLAVRLVGLTDPPLGFHPTRQYHGLIVARAMYVADRSSISVQERRTAQLNRSRDIQLEPPLMERVVAAGYVLTGHEVPWYGRLFSTLAWLAGGVALFALTRRVFDQTAAFVALAFFLFVPYGVEAGRSFQPDPLMVALTVTTLLLVVRHHQAPSTRDLLAAAVVGGIAVFVKGVSVFPIAAVFAALAFVRHGWRRVLLQREVWVFGAIALLPSLAFYVYGVATGGQLQSQFRMTFIPHLFVTGFFWSGWWRQVDTVVSAPLALIALIGSVAFARRPAQRALVVGWWLGYLLYAASVPYHIATHNYYQLPIIPIVSLGLGMVATTAAARLTAAGLRVAPPILAALLLVVLVAAAAKRVHPVPRGTARSTVALYERIGALAGHSDGVLMLSNDYGYDLRYHGDVSGVSWPERIDDRLTRLQGKPIPSLDDRFRQLSRAVSAKWFAVTDMDEWKNQLSLQDYLNSHATRVAGSNKFVLYRLDGAPA
ncbi:MAG: glycosyltransferase family 39 protein [Actinobacteria bacterium]|nr:glycosyltransferase family 39 protein [Actinomycetota bacterium]